MFTIKRIGLTKWGKPWLRYEKKNLKHLSRRELVDLICEMEKTNLLVDVQALEEAKKEQRRLKDRSSHSGREISF